MSLDFTLTVNDEDVFSRNITHNLTNMADAAGIYQVLWHPEQFNSTKAVDCIEPLKNGLFELISNKAKYEAMNSPNGWGMYEDFVPFVTAVLTACCEYPLADIHVSI